jgi:hypothetical protein
MAKKSKPAAAAKAAGGRDLIARANPILASERPAIERLRLRTEIIAIRTAAKQRQLGAKLAEALAKLGGGSLLTATLLLFIQGQAGRAALVTAGLTLLLFVGGITFSALFERWSAKRDAEADGLQAVLNETGI